MQCGDSGRINYFKSGADKKTMVQTEVRCLKALCRSNPRSGGDTPNNVLSKLEGSDGLQESLTGQGQ